MIVYVSSFPGAGKSTVGPQVSARLRWSLVDVDAYVDEGERRKIADDGFSADRYDQFMQRVFLPALAQESGKDTLVLGGLLFPSHRDILEAMASDIHFIFLTAPYSVLEERVARRDHFVGTKTLERSWYARDMFDVRGTVVDANQDIEAVTEALVHVIKTLPSSEK